MKTRLSSVVGLSVALWMAGATGSARVSADTVVEPSPVGRMVHNMNPANWTMPQWKMPNFRSILPGQEEKAVIKKNKDGFVDGVQKSAQKSWTRTKEVLDPQKLNPKRLFPGTLAGSKTPSNPSEPEKPGFFGSLFAPEPESEKPKTVNDFLDGKRPGM